MRNTPVDEMFEVKFVDAEIPGKARIFNSVHCTKCGEMMAESRARVQNGEYICIPCYEEYNRGW
jgi:formylmethanofuran dehydrogenase subunit E